MEGAIFWVLVMSSLWEAALCVCFMEIQLAGPL